MHLGFSVALSFGACRTGCGTLLVSCAIVSSGAAFPLQRLIDCGAAG